MSDSGAPKLGPLGVWTFQLDLQPAPRAQELAAELEELGFGALWVPELVGREPLVNAALLLSGTRRMTVATGIASLHARTAMTMNAGWRTLSEAFPERFLLGIGVSHQSVVEGTHQGQYAKPYSTMVDYLDRMDASRFLAAEHSAPPRRLLAALGPRMLELAAARGAGAHTYFVPVEHTAEARGVLGQEALLAPELTVVLDNDAGTARAIGRRFMATYLALPNYVGNLRRLGWPEDDLADGGSDRLVDALIAWGPPERIAARVQQHLDAGADHVALQVLSADVRGLPLAEWRELASTIPSLRPRRSLLTTTP